MGTSKWAAPAAVIVLALGLQATSAQAACWRHIVNNSQCPWWFGAIPSDNGGHVYFGHGTDPNCTQKQGPCKVAAGQTIDVQYTTDNTQIGGTMYLVDQYGAYWAPTYDNTSTQPGCPVINHRGATGAVAFNDPANGDLNAWACSWGAAPPSNVVVKKHPPKAMSPMPDKRRR